MVCEMSQTNRIKQISRNWGSQRFNSHPCCPLNTAVQPPSFLSSFLKKKRKKRDRTVLRSSFLFPFNQSCLFNNPACAIVRTGGNALMPCYQNDWKIISFHQKEYLLPTAVVLFLLSALPVIIVEVCDLCAVV